MQKHNIYLYFNDILIGLIKNIYKFLLINKTIVNLYLYIILIDTTQTFLFVARKIGLRAIKMARSMMDNH